MKKMAGTGLAVLLTLSACASDKETKPLCPQTAIVRELERSSDSGVQARMLRVEGTCAYDKTSVTVDAKLALAAAKEARLKSDRASFPYFVAILDPEQRIIAKKLLTVAFTFRDGASAEKTEPLHLTIPLAKEADGENYRVLMGFQLTEAQLTATRHEEEERIGKRLERDTPQKP